MAEIDIDKMLEAKEREEEKKQAAKRAYKIGGIALIALAAAGAIAAVLLVAMGEKSDKYFLMGMGSEYMYNVTGGTPEEWKILPERAEVEGKLCVVLNRKEMSAMSTTQEYYCMDKKEGIKKAAVSSNNGQKKRSSRVLLPPRIKEGLEFSAGSVRGREIAGAIVSKGKEMTMAGETEVITVTYKALPYVDEEIKFGRGLGVISIKDSVRNLEIGLSTIK